MQFFLPLVKADQEKRLVYARAAAEEPDKSNEIMDYATGKVAFQTWSKQYEDVTLGKSFGNVRAMHNPRHLAGTVQKLDYDDEGMFVGAMIKVLDPVDWAKVEGGGYTGISIGGGYAKKWPDPLNKNLTRYTPRIQEISFVDSPCIPSALIMEMQKADGTIEEVMLKGIPRTFAALVPPRTFGQMEKGLIGAAIGAGAGAAAGRYVGRRVGVLRGVLRGVDDMEHQAHHVLTGERVGRHVGTAAGGVAGLGAGALLTRGKQKKTIAAIKQEILANLEKAGFPGIGGRVAGAFANRGKTFNLAGKPKPAHVTASTRTGPVVVSEEGGTGASYSNRGKTFTKEEEAAGLVKLEGEREKIRQTMHEFKHGALRSYRGLNDKGRPRKGPKVTDRRQAIAIALNQARRMGKTEPAFIAALSEHIDRAA